MKTIKTKPLKKMILASLLLGSLSVQTIAQESTTSPQSGGILRTDIDAVLNTKVGVGGISNPSLPGSSIRLEEGVFAAETDGGPKDQFIVINQPYANDPDKGLVLFAPREVMMGDKVGYGWIFQSRPVRNGRSLMLSSISVDRTTGDAVIDSENEKDAPVLLMSKKPQDHLKYPFILEGRNGALDGSVLNMKKDKFLCKKPNLKPYPSTGMYVATSASNNKLVVMDGQVSFHFNNGTDASFEILQLNGDSGKLGGLVSSKFDTMGEVDIAFENISMLATFFTYGDKEKTERFLIATPVPGKGFYKFEVFKIAKDQKHVLKQFFSWIKAR